LGKIDKYFAKIEIFEKLALKMVKNNSWSHEVTLHTNSYLYMAKYTPTDGLQGKIAKPP